MMNNEMADCVESFLRGEGSMFFIVRAGVVPSNLKRQDFLFRKLDDTCISILGSLWFDKAEEFLRKNFSVVNAKLYCVVEVRGVDFKAFLSQFSADEKRLVKIEMI
ncbi:MAG: hypothetical protein V1809_12250 [Planctomycetota bacterium]